MFWYWNAPSDAQTSNSVTIHATVQRTAETKHEKSAKRTADESNIVAWLKPLDRTASASETNSADRKRVQLVQHNKNFQPHVLVVPVGSVVDFPNRDPFFHNVFSLFDGKRFDLGLYEAGTSNSVKFDRVGVSFLFCNIHPEMSAVVVAVDTPFFATSDASGNISIPNVPAGRYELHLWYERSLPDDLNRLTHMVTISSQPADLGMVRVQENPNFSTAHKNKYGQDYAPPKAPTYSQP